jgi:hypothetical protein
MGWLMYDEQIRKTVGRDQIEVLYQHVRGGSEWNHEKPHAGRYPIRYSMAFMVSIKYKCTYPDAVWMRVHSYEIAVQ